jgi:hypothetical protein
MVPVARAHFAGAAGREASLDDAQRPGIDVYSPVSTTDWAPFTRSLRSVTWIITARACPRSEQRNASSPAPPPTV